MPPSDPPAPEPDFAGLRDVYDRLAAVASVHGSVLVPPNQLCDTANAMARAEEMRRELERLRAELDDAISLDAVTAKREAAK